MMIRDRDFLLLVTLAMSVYTFYTVVTFIADVTDDATTLEAFEEWMGRDPINHERSRAISQLWDLQIWVEMERMEKGRLPSEIPLIKDPWSSPYVYNQIHDCILIDYVLLSAGEDGIYGTEKDLMFDRNGMIVNPEERKLLWNRK